MADRKITDLTALTTPASADVLPIVDVSEAAAADKNKKVTVGELFKGIPDGTAAAPAIAFESDDGNGLFLSTTDTIGIATNGVSRATVSTTAVTSTLPISATAFSPTSATVPTNGVYLPATNSVGIATNGTGRLFVDASGNVGVGSTPGASAARVLDINGITLQPILTLRRSSSTSATASIDLDSDNNLVNFISSDFPVRYFINGDERLRITSDGKVGIGTSSASSRLHVYGSDSTLTNIQSTAASTYLLLGNSNNNLGYIGYEGTKFNFYPNNTANALVVTPTGVGIGTTSPGVLLHAKQNDAVGPTIQLENNAQSVFINNWGSTGQGGNRTNRFEVNATATGYAAAICAASQIELHVGGANNERARIDSSGRLLVGTSSAYVGYGGSADNRFQIAGSSYTTGALSAFVFGSTTDGGYLNLGLSRNTTVGSHTVVQSGDTLGSITFNGSDGTTFKAAADITCRVDGTPGTNDMPGRLVFSTTADGASSPTERMRIRSDGAFTLSDNATLDPIGSSKVGGFAAGNGANSGAINYYAGNTIALKLGRGNDGDLVTFFRNQPGATQVGAIYVTTTATQYNSGSDYRLKENIVPLNDGINRLMQLKPSRFNFIVEPDTIVDGFIAHEAQEVVPQAVTGTKDAVDDNGDPVYQGIDQSKLVPLLTAALQEAVAKIESLEARLTALESA